MADRRDGHCFLHYELIAETLCLGERIRGGLFRPCSRVFRYNSLVGALKFHFEISGPIHAAARFLEGAPGTNRMETLSFAPFDRGCNHTLVPLEIEFLSNVHAEVFVLKANETQHWPQTFNLSMGAMKSKGFGRCRFRILDEVHCQDSVKGKLCVRLPDVKEIRDVFGVRNILAPVHGYLFQSTSLTSGVYTKSLFEDSEIVSYDILLKKTEAGL